MLHYTLLLATGLHICTQAFMFGDRPDQCRNTMETAARAFAESGVSHLPITDATRDKERNLWKAQYEWLRDRECFDYKKDAPREYAVCVQQVKNYMNNLQSKYEARAAHIRGVK
jgi:hypothetical protein